MNTALFLIGMAIAAAVFYFFILPRLKESKRIKGIWRALDGLGYPKHLAQFKYKYTTHSGASIDSVDPVPAKVMDWYDAEIWAMLADHRKVWPEWTTPKDLAGFSLLFVTPSYFTKETLPIGTPAIGLSAGTTAGTCIGVNGMSAADRPYLVLPSFSSVDWGGEYEQALKDAMYNEGEHCDEYAQDIRVGLYFSNNYEAEVHPHDLAAVRGKIDRGEIQ